MSGLPLKTNALYCGDLGSHLEIVGRTHPIISDTVAVWTQDAEGDVRAWGLIKAFNTLTDGEPYLD